MGCNAWRRSVNGQASEYAHTEHDENWLESRIILLDFQSGLLLRFCYVLALRTLLVFFRMHLRLGLTSILTPDLENSAKNLSIASTSHGRDRCLLPSLANLK